MKTARVLAVAAIVAGCSGLEHSSPVVRSDAADVVGEPVFQPMLVVGMPQLRAAASTSRPIEAMTARNTPVADVLLSLFKDSEINLLVDESAQAAACTFDIKQATVEEAFESLLRSLDLAYEWDGSFLRIRSAVRQTLYVDLLASGGQSAPSGSSSSSSGGETGGGAPGFWVELEKVLPQILGDKGKAIVNQAASTIHVEASPGAVERLRELVDTTIRRSNAQVSLEARILEVRLDDQHNLGVNWSLLPGLFKSSKTGLASGGSVISQAAASGGTALNFGVLDGGDFSVFVDALEQQGQVRVLSSPRVATMNNVPASIRIADQVPFINREVITDQGVARSEFNVEFVEAGVSVQVTPMIGEDGMITVRITPEVTEQTGTVVTPDGLIEQPILSKRSTSTVVRVADGQAIALGGLRSTRKDETRQGVPFLMDVPFLGQLFSSTVQNREEVELMIVLVPRVLDAAWIDEEVRRGAHRLVTLRRPFQWNSIGHDSFRPEDYAGGTLLGQPFAASKPEARYLEPVPPAAGAGRTLTRAGLAERLLARAQQALDESQVRQALVWLEQALLLDPRRLDALVAAGILLERQGNHARARQMLERALAVEPADPLAATARGALELTSGSAHAARRWFEAAHARIATSWSACNLAAAMLLCGETEAACTFLRGAADDQSPPELHANLTWAELAGGDVAAARKSLQRALTAGADPRNPRINALVRMVEEAERKARVPAR